MNNKIFEVQNPNDCFEQHLSKNIVGMESQVDKNISYRSKKQNIENFFSFFLQIISIIYIFFFIIIIYKTQVRTLFIPAFLI